MVTELYNPHHNNKESINYSSSSYLQDSYKDSSEPRVQVQQTTATATTTVAVAEPRQRDVDQSAQYATIHEQELRTVMRTQTHKR